VKNAPRRVLFTFSNKNRINKRILSSYSCCEQLEQILFFIAGEGVPQEMDDVNKKVFTVQRGQ